MNPFDPKATPEHRAQRRLICATLLGLGGLAIAGLRTSPAAARGLAGAGKGEATLPALMTVVEFRNDGTRVRALQLPRVVRSDAGWKRLLPLRSYQVTRHGATETPFTGAYNGLHDIRGVFRCICCGTALFDARTKFDSGTGWPSFWQPIAAENIRALDDLSFGLPPATEIRCRRCDAHLGHVFDDGPKPTGLRYCINSVALRYFAA